MVTQATLDTIATEATNAQIIKKARAIGGKDGVGFWAEFYAKPIHGELAAGSIADIYIQNPDNLLHETTGIAIGYQNTHTANARTRVAGDIAGVLKKTNQEYVLGLAENLIGTNAYQTAREVVLAGGNATKVMVNNLIPGQALYQDAVNKSSIGELTGAMQGIVQRIRTHEMIANGVMNTARTVNLPGAADFDAAAINAIANATEKNKYLDGIAGSYAALKDPTHFQ